jgi:hypothetical protein
VHPHQIGTDEHAPMRFNPSAPQIYIFLKKKLTRSGCNVAIIKSRNKKIYQNTISKQSARCKNKLQTTDSAKVTHSIRVDTNITIRK